MSRCLPVALVQTEPLPTGAPFAQFAADVAGVLRRFPATQLLVYPELHLYGDAIDDINLAQSLDGELSNSLAELAGRLGVWLVPGTLLEAIDGGMHNTAVVYSPQGELVASYRKCFPWRPYEPYRPGTEFVVFEIPDIGRFGLSICYDTWFPELSRQLAWLGAEAIIAPTRTTTSDRAQELILTRANAIANQVHVLSVNVAAPTGVGQSLLVDPEGRIRVEANRSPEVLTDVIDLDDVSRVRDYGTSGLNRIWAQFRPDDSPLDLPAYAGRIDPKTWSPRHPAQ
ncbi:MAG TPA: carbon-nitrogen hydrolase family protein [Pseudonocardiaceae bacterium]|nr:carbon-nitrogen hydrolase family protein [Pseudonocardiaceae bacterium]